MESNRRMPGSDTLPRLIGCVWLGCLTDDCPGGTRRCAKNGRCVFKEKLATVADEAPMDGHEMKIAIVETHWNRGKVVL